MNSFVFNFWIDHFDNVINGADNKLKYLMLSAHDSNLGYVLPGLNITNYRCIVDIFHNGKTEDLNCFPGPKFASNLLLELHQDEDTNEYYIMIDYNGEYVNLCEKKSTKCAYEEFK